MGGKVERKVLVLEGFLALDLSALAIDRDIAECFLERFRRPRELLPRLIGHHDAAAVFVEDLAGRAIKQNQRRDAILRSRFSKGMASQGISLK